MWPLSCGIHAANAFLTSLARGISLYNPLAGQRFSLRSGRVGHTNRSVFLEVEDVISYRIKSIAAATIIVVLFATPFAIGFVFAMASNLDGATNGAITDLANIPADGLPHKFAITVPQRNAWAAGTPQVVGYVFLRRSLKPATVTGLAATHSYPLNIPVEFDAQDDRFTSICWHVEFDSDGRSLNPGIPDLQHVPVTLAGDVVTAQLK